MEWCPYIWTWWNPWVVSEDPALNAGLPIEFTSNARPTVRSAPSYTNPCSFRLRACWQEEQIPHGICRDEWEVHPPLNRFEKPKSWPCCRRAYATLAAMPAPRRSQEVRAAPSTRSHRPHMPPQAASTHHGRVSRTPRCYRRFAAPRCLTNQDEISTIDAKPLGLNRSMKTIGETIKNPSRIKRKTKHPIKNSYLGRTQNMSRFTRDLEGDWSNIAHKDPSNKTPQEISRIWSEIVDKKSP